jgi:PAS domain S-box-containing protein
MGSGMVDSEERYRMLWQRNVAGVFRSTVREGRLLDCNDAFARMFGHPTREEMFRHSTRELYGDLRIREELIALLRQHGVMINHEMCMRRADGSPIWALENVSLLREDDEEILEGTIIDITERKRAEEALRASEANYRTLINHLDQAIFLKDRDLRYVAVNPIFCESLGLTEEQVHGKTSSELLPEHILKQSHLLEQQVLRDARAIQTEDTLTVKGKPRIVRINRTPVKGDDGTVAGVLGIAWDVTDQRAMEAQMRHVQKMEAIGQLAGGIAHDFNNLLTIMLGNLSFILNQANVPHTVVEIVHNAEKAGLRAAELTQTLLAFSRRSPLKTVSFCLHQAVDEVIRLTRATIPPTIALKVQAQPDLWTVQADPGQINQVLTNLTLNARDAMPHGGTITYWTSHFVPDAGYLSSHVEAQPGEFVRLRVEDTGEGIAPEHRQRIFEPFFTTKEKRKGTGLGLAVVFTIVKQHKGWIVCESEPKQGARFDIFLPRCHEPLLATPKPLAVNAAALNEMILLVDDESMVRQLSKTILTKAGYHVLLAEHGEQAIEIFASQKDRIALVILDAIMPRLSGRETLRELTRLKPQIRVLFSSGFSTEQLLLSDFPQVRGFLPKPYRAEQLIEKVRDILNNKS